MVAAHDFNVRRSEQFLGSWRMVRKRELPMYFVRRMLLGRYFGRPNLMVLAEKQSLISQPIADPETVHCQS
jgi:hypothetical protein